MSERLDRIEELLQRSITESDARMTRIEGNVESCREAIDSLRQSVDNLLEVQSLQGESIDRLLEGQLFLQGLGGQLSEQTLQLKRAVDYLMSQDGGPNLES